MVRFKGGYVWLKKKKAGLRISFNALESQNAVIKAIAKIYFDICFTFCNLVEITFQPFKIFFLLNTLLKILLGMHALKMYFYKVRNLDGICIFSSN